jgi:hypothetical protein
VAGVGCYGSALHWQSIRPFPSIGFSYNREAGKATHTQTANKKPPPFASRRRPTKKNEKLTHPTQMSKILDPTEEETAMSPSPLRATMTDVIKSGMDVPAARNVKPIT